MSNEFNKAESFGADYLFELKKHFASRGIQFTQKVGEVIESAASKAYDTGTGVYDSTLMASLIRNKTVILNVLDIHEIDISTYLNEMDEDSSLSWSEYFDESTLNEIVDELCLLLVPDRVGLQSFRVLDLAAEIASSSHGKVIDTKSFILALFRQATSFERKLTRETIRQLGKTNLSDQVYDRVQSTVGEDELKEWYGKEFSIIDAPLEWVLEELRDGCVSGVSPILEKLANKCKNLRSLAKIEYDLKMANVIEPYLDDTKFALISTTKGIIFREFSYLNSYKVLGFPEPSAVKINVLSSGKFIRYEEIDEFEELINLPNVSEYDLQKFFEHRPWFLLGSNYERLHSQLALVNDTDTELVPDFFAEKIGTSYSDIIDLKKPTEKVIVGPKHRRGFTAALTNALNQLREYRNYFDDSKNRKAFYARHGLYAFRPNVCVVIGRSSDYLDHIERIKIDDEYKNMKVVTYDDILVRSKRMALVI